MPVPLTAREDCLTWSHIYNFGTEGCLTRWYLGMQQHIRQLDMSMMNGRAQISAVIQFDTEAARNDWLADCEGYRDPFTGEISGSWKFDLSRYVRE